MKTATFFLVLLFAVANSFRANAAFGGGQLIGFIPFDEIPENVTNIDPTGFSISGGTLNIQGTVIFLLDDVPTIAAFQVPVTSAEGDCGMLSLNFALDLQASGVPVAIPEVTFAIFSLPETTPPVHNLLCVAAKLVTKGKGLHGAAAVLNRIFPALQP